MLVSSECLDTKISKLVKTFKNNFKVLIAADADIVKDFKIGDDNVPVKVETDATAFTAATVFNLATATQFESVSNLAGLTANLGYEFSSYYTPDLL